MAGLNEFEEMINNDEAFKNKLEAAASPEEALAIIKEAGFDITEDELVTELSAELEKMDEGELDDDSLLEVSGGRSLSNKLGRLNFNSISLLQRLFGNVLKKSNIRVNVNDLRFNTDDKPNIVAGPYREEKQSGNRKDNGIFYC